MRRSDRAAAALEVRLASVALGIDAFGRRRFYRVARAVRHGVALGQETLLAFRRCLGSAGVAAAFVRDAQAASVKVPLHYPELWLTPAAVTPMAEALRQGECLLKDGTRVPIERISWRRNRHGKGFDLVPVLFHAVYWVRELLDAHSLTGDTAYLGRAVDLVDRWIAECLYSERVPQVWDPHGTGLRAILLCQLWTACREGEPEGSSFLARLLAAIVRHAEKLARPGFYHPDHNHGMAQAYGLFMIGVLFQAHPAAWQWTALGRSRLESQMRDNVSPEGLHREHSPYYQFFVFQQFYGAYRLGEAYDVTFSPAYTDRLDRMFAASAHLVKPNGALPALGDTSRTSPILLGPRDVADQRGRAVQEYLWSRSGGREGVAPEATSVLWPDGGLAILRSGWGAPERWEDERFLAVRLATFRTAHIHRDVLSFELYGYGDDLVVDAGGPYVYGDPIRLSYFLSTRAHNTVLVDDQDQQIGAARVVRWSTSPEVDVLVAEHRPSQGVVHRRAVLFVRRAYVVILDRVEGQRPHRYSQLFHLNPALDVRLSGAAVSTDHATGGPTVRLLPLEGAGLAVRLHRGAVAPRQGWVCVRPGEMEANTVVEYQRSGTAATFAVVLIPEAPGRSLGGSAEIDGTPLEGHSRVRVRIGDRVDELTLSPDAEVTFLGGPGDARSVRDAPRSERV